MKTEKNRQKIVRERDKKIEIKQRITFVILKQKKDFSKLFKAILAVETLFKASQGST